MWVAGVDGCKGGWVALVVEGGDFAKGRVRGVASLTDLFTMGVDFALVDMPIGLADGTCLRDVERAARAALPGKASSIFPVPARDTLAATTYADACALNSGVLGKKIPQQTFAIFPKLREVDACARGPGAGRIAEGHPEVSFALAAGRVLTSRKRKPDGRRERQAVLKHLGLDLADTLIADARLTLRAMGLKAGADDILDAAILAWSALRIQRGEDRCFPDPPGRDRYGLEMAIRA